MSAASLDPDDCSAQPPTGRRVLGQALVRAVRLLADRMNDPDKVVATQAATEIMRLSLACLRHGYGFPLDWADGSLDDDPRPCPRGAEPVEERAAGRADPEATPSAKPREPVPCRRHPAEATPPPSRTRPDHAPALTADDWAEFSEFAHSMGFDPGAIDLVRRTLHRSDRATGPPARAAPARPVPAGVASG